MRWSIFSTDPMGVPSGCGQTDFGHPYLTDFGQSDFGQKNDRLANLN